MIIKYGPFDRSKTRKLSIPVFNSGCNSFGRKLSKRFIIIKNKVPMVLAMLYKSVQCSISKFS